MKLKSYLVKYSNPKPIMFIAKDIKTALLDAIVFSKDEIETIQLVSDLVHIDFKRENEAVADFLKVSKE